MEKTYKMWHVIIAFILGGVIIGGISFVPSFGTKGFFQKNVGEEAVSEEAGGESLTDVRVERNIEEGETVNEAGGVVPEDAVVEDAGEEVSSANTDDDCVNIDAKVAAAQKILDEAMANYSKEVQTEAYDDFVEVLKKKNECSG